MAGIFRIPERRVGLEPDEIRELFFDATERAIPRPRRPTAAGADRRRVEGLPRQDA